MLTAPVGGAGRGGGGRPRNWFTFYPDVQEESLQTLESLETPGTMVGQSFADFQHSVALCGNYGCCRQGWSGILRTEVEAHALCQAWWSLC